MTKVINLRTGEERFYTCSAHEAVVCAYAQERGDWNTWEYEQRYGKLVEESERCVFCGDWAALKHEPPSTNYNQEVEHEVRNSTH